MKEEIIEEIIKFRDERNWNQFHTPKDLSISISIEANELLEIFQWKEDEEVLDKNKKEIKEELADIMIYAIILSHELDIDLEKAIYDKLNKNSKKYPVDKAYGSNKKYDEL